MTADEKQERLERARSASRAADGWLTDAEGDLLERLSAACPPGSVVVEIGLWKGKSTIRLAAGVEPGAGTRVFAIDPHQGALEDPGASTFSEFQANLARAGVADVVEAIVAPAEAVVDRFDAIQLLFIDGNHEEPGVRRDLEGWLPRIAPGGTLAMHDVLNERWPAVRRVLRGALWRSRVLAEVRVVDSMACARKVSRNRVADRWRNRVMAALLAAYDIRPGRLPAPLAAFLRRIYRLTVRRSNADG